MLDDTEDAIRNLFTQIETHVPGQFEWNSNLQYVIAGLATKALSNCHVAKELALQNCLGEALILLRSGHEPIVIMHYLIQHPEQVSTYQNHSRLVEYKDRLLAFDRNPEERVMDLPAAHMNVLKQEIITEKLLSKSYFKRHKYDQSKQLFSYKSILDNAEAFSKSLANYFANFWQMTDELFKDLPAIYQNLKVSKTIVYNLGSQLSHSVWRGVQDLYLEIDGKGKPIGPEVDQTRIFIGIVILLDFAIGGLDTVGIVPGVYQRLKNSFSTASTELTADLVARSAAVGTV